MKLWRKFTILFRRKSLEAEMAEEIRLHLERRVEENVAAGMSAEDARHAARPEFGGMEQVKEIVREQRENFLTRAISLFLGDVRFAVRQLLKAPGFTLVAIFTLALGIGANVAIFSFVNATALRPLRVDDPERMVRLMRTNASGDTRAAGFSYPEFNAFREQASSMSSVIAASGVTQVEVSAVVVDTTSRSNSSTLGTEARVQLVSGNYFSVIQARFEKGRSFAPEEDAVPGRDPVVIVSHRFWQTSLGGDAAVLGREIVLGRERFSVIGVLAADYPRLQLNETGEADIWVPLMMHREILGSPAGQSVAESPEVGSFKRSAQAAAFTRDLKMDRLTAYGQSWLNLNGRLKPNMSREQAQQELGVIVASLDRSNPDAVFVRGAGYSGVAVEAATLMKLGNNGVISVLFAAPILLLVVACANLANLILARGASRMHEIAIRRSLGASRARIVHQLFTENLLLGLCGGIAGLIFAVWLARIFVALMFGGWSVEVIDPGLDGRVAAFAFGLSILTPVLFGWLPALRVSDFRLTHRLKDGGSHHRGGSSLNQNQFVFCQVAVSVFLLITSGVLIRVFFHGSRDPGRELDRIVVIEPGLMKQGYSPERVDELFRQLVERVSAHSGVESAGVTEDRPWRGGGRTRVSVERDVPGQASASGVVAFTNVTPGYFAAMGMQTVKGRTLESDDVGRFVVVVTASTAQRFWPGENPVGQTLFSNTHSAMEVVGVVEENLDAEVFPNQPHVYRHLPPRTFGSIRDKIIVARLKAKPAVLLPALINECRALDPNFVPRFQLLSDVASEQTAAIRPFALFAVSFGVAALLLAALGIYGVMAYIVTQRTSEIGVRIALGATPGSVIRLFLRRGFRLVIWGFAAGSVGTWAVTRWLHSQIIGVELTEPLTFGGVLLVLAAVAFFACWLPARRAARVDPMVALRAE